MTGDRKALARELSRTGAEAVVGPPEGPPAASEAGEAQKCPHGSPTSRRRLPPLPVQPVTRRAFKNNKLSGIH